MVNWKRSPFSGDSFGTFGSFCDRCSCGGKKKLELCRALAYGRKEKPELCGAVVRNGKKKPELCRALAYGGKGNPELCGARTHGGKEIRELCGPAGVKSRGKSFRLQPQPRTTWTFPFQG